MCLGVPHKVIAVNHDLDQITVRAFGQEKVCSIMLIDEPVALGDYVLLQVGDFVTEILSEQQATEVLALLEKLEITRHERV